MTTFYPLTKALLNRFVFDDGIRAQGGYIEVRHENVSKGAFLDRILNRMMEQGKQVDFVLCIGDDPSDENMFAAAEAYGGERARAKT